MIREMISMEINNITNEELELAVLLMIQKSIEKSNDK